MSWGEITGIHGPSAVGRPAYSYLPVARVIIIIGEYLSIKA